MNPYRSAAQRARWARATTDDRARWLAGLVRWQAEWADPAIHEARVARLEARQEAALAAAQEASRAAVREYIARTVEAAGAVNAAETDLKIAALALADADRLFDAAVAAMKAEARGRGWSPAALDDEIDLYLIEHSAALNDPKEDPR